MANFLTYSSGINGGVEWVRLDVDTTVSIFAIENDPQDGGPYLQVMGTIYQSGKERSQRPLHVGNAPDDPDDPDEEGTLLSIPITRELFGLFGSAKLEALSIAEMLSGEPIDDPDFQVVVGAARSPDEVLVTSKYGSGSVDDCTQHYFDIDHFASIVAISNTISGSLMFYARQSKCDLPLVFVKENSEKVPLIVPVTQEMFDLFKSESVGLDGRRGDL